MIYKFQDEATTMEVEQFNEKTISFSILDENDNPVNAYLSKKDVYHLIGALHLLHKEMK